MKFKKRMKYDSEKMKEGIDRIANIVESMREMSQSSKRNKEKNKYLWNFDNFFNNSI